MKLLLDENLSFRLCRQLADLFEEVRHVKEFDLLHTDDALIWNFARSHGYVIVTQDSDFVGRAVIDGPKPKVVWVQVGNAPRVVFAALIRDSCDALHRFDLDPQRPYCVLSLGAQL